MDERLKPLGWSTAIQGIACLDVSRELRFPDERKALVLWLLQLESGMTILDAGCGPGTLVRRLMQWLGRGTLVVGVDRDDAFIRYARQRAADAGTTGARFICGDALRMPLGDGSIDACVSHTVIEHVPNREFLEEQRRVCRPSGRVSVMMTLAPPASVVTFAEGWPPPSKREKELWKPIAERQAKADAAMGVGAFSPGPPDLPRLFDALGFTDVRVDAAAFTVAADDARHNYEHRRMIIEAEQSIARERLEMGLRLLDRPLSQAHVDELRALMGQRFAERLTALEAGRSVWDYSVITTLVVSGRA